MSIPPRLDFLLHLQTFRPVIEDKIKGSYCNFGRTVGNSNGCMARKVALLANIEVESVIHF